MPESPLSETSTKPATFTTRRKVLTATAAVSALSATAALLLQSGDAQQPPAKHSTVIASAPATPDPLATDNTQSDSTTVPDHTRNSARAAAGALDNWGSTNPSSSNENTVRTTPTSGPGGAIHEVLRIPALGKDWAVPVYDGIGQAQLRSGVGHFPTTEQPGDIGNYALAGHRSGVVTPPFRNINRVTPGAAITVTTAQRITYTYTVTRTRTVDPADVNVIAQVPGRPDATPTTAKLTLVTCWPATGHTRRVVVAADLISAKGGA
ncbi:sortase [Streptomyces sp. NPDC101062]|uniref:sortase n=1 Tax=unclassified Streptomyces TaxID=2593676 RepID=UPI00382C6DF6